MNSGSSARQHAREVRGQAYREAVIEAAERLFAERGIESTKMEELASAAGLSIATLYSVFSGGKAEIVRSIHHDRLTELVEFAVEEVNAPDPPAACLRRAVESAVGFFMAHPDYLRMHLREGHAWCMPDAVAARTREGAEGWADGVGAMIAILERGVAEGVFDTDSARRMGKAVVMLQQLHLAEWIEGGQEESFAVVFERYWADVEALLGMD